MASKPEKTREEPEAPPRFDRRIILGVRQWIGLIVLISIPVLALLGVLGDGRDTKETRSGGFTLKVDSPLCARYGNALRVTIEIVGPAVSDEQWARVEVSSAYLARFSAIGMAPGAIAHTADAVVFSQLLPREGGMSPVLIEMTPESYGWARGWVRVTLASGEHLELPLKTFIFP